MFTTAVQTEMQDLLKIFSEDTRKIYGDHAYAAGYYESMIVQMLHYLPKRVQKDFTEDVRRAVVRTKTRLLEAQNENRIFERI